MLRATAGGLILGPWLMRTSACAGHPQACGTLVLDASAEVLRVSTHGRRKRQRAQHGPPSLHPA